MRLIVQWPRHPDWQTHVWDITPGKPFYLIGSEGKYTILEGDSDMNTLWDVLRRVVDSKPFTEAEQALAHKIIGEHEAIHSPQTGQPEGDTPEADTAPAPGEGE